MNTAVLVDWFDRHYPGLPLEPDRWANVLPAHTPTELGDALDRWHRRNPTQPPLAAAIAALLREPRRDEIVAGHIQRARQAIRDAQAAPLKIAPPKVSR